MKLRPLLFFCATTLLYAEPPTTDAQLERDAAIAVAKARAERIIATEEKAQTTAEARRIRESGLTIAVKIFQIVPGEGYLAKPIDDAFTGPERLVRVPREAVVQGTGLRAHLKVKETWVEQHYERQRVKLAELIFIRAATVGLVDGQGTVGLVWPIEPYHYTSVDGGGKTIPAYTARPPTKK